MTRSARLLFAVLLTLFAVTFPALAQNVTVSGTVNFSSLDGGPDDADHTINGVFTVNGDLIVNGTISCNDGSGHGSACPMAFNVGHDLIINAGGAIYAENRTGSGSGAPISFTVGNDFVMHGPAGTLAGAMVSTDSASSSHSSGGDITATVAGAVTIESGATIDSGSANAAAGAISITAGGHVDAGGNLLAGPSRTILSTRLTDAALSGGTGNQVGGAISVKSTSMVQPAIHVGSDANIVSQGQVTSAGPVSLEGCGIVVDGLVASLASKDATSRVVLRSGKTITVDGRDLGVANATLGRNGMLRGDATSGSAANHLVDLFAYGDITVLGPDGASSALFAIVGTSGGNGPNSDGATVRIVSLTGGVTASGNVVTDGGTASGDAGGSVTVSSQGDINLDHAVLESTGDSHTHNPHRGGGSITLRSYSGNVIWTNGTGDVRPTGSGSGLAAAAQGQISITACGSISLSGSTFPTNGSPVGVFPGQTTSACTPAAPSLPAGEPPLPVCCNVITITNPSVTTGTAGTAFSQTFTQSGAIGTATFSLASGTLPAGLTPASNGTLSGTPTVVGSFPIVVQVTDSQGCTGVGSTYNLVINCQTITVNNPAVNTTVAGSPFSVTFTQSGAIGGATFSTTSNLPAGLVLTSNGVLSGTPTVVGPYTIVVTATDANGCTGSSSYTLTISCQTITVTNPAVSSGVANSPFSATFTQSGAIGGATFSTASTLPAGLTLSAGGVLSGTPAQTGTFPIVVTATDANGCQGTGATYTLTIACQTITVTNPAANSGTVNSAFSATFTASNTIGATTFTTASALPAGLTLAANGTLSGTPTQTGTFPIVVTATDANGCSGTGATYTLTIGCQIITVNNPGVSSGTAGSPFSATFTASNSVGATTFTTASALPAGITLASNGTLSGTPTVVGTFPIVVTATDANGCSGSGATYNLVINCQTITVNDPPSGAAVAGSPFSATFTASNTIGATTFSTASVLPAGMSLSASGVLSGTPVQVGTFSIVVTATDGNGCSGSGAPYTLVVACQAITVNAPSTTTATANAPFSATFTASNTIGTTTFTTSSTLPAGLTLASNGTLSGTPTQTGSFPIVVTATDANGCSGSASYTLTVACQTITVTNPATSTGTVNAPFSQQFTASNTIGATSFSTASGLPAGLTLAADGTLSGTPMQPGSFPIVVIATDANGCTGTSATYTLVIGCQTITVTNPATNSGTVGVAFSQQFTQSGGFGTTTFSTASTLPTGLTLAADGTLSGTPTQSGTFPIVVTATDANGCSGSSSYTLTIACNVITVQAPAANSFIAGQAFSVTFTQSGGNGTVTFSESGALPSGVTLSTSGALSGATTQTGSFPIVVTATDANGCSGSVSYTLNITCNTITITNPATNTATAGTPFSATFTASGILGTATWSESGALPSGIALNVSTGVLSGTTSQTGAFAIVVKVTDSNGCFTTSAYTLTVNCQSISVTNPAANSATAGNAFSATFTASGILGTATWSESGALPSGVTLNASTGVLSGTPTQTGSFPITVTVTDSNGCSGSGPTYTLTVACPTITLTRTGGGTFPAATIGSAYAGQSLTASGSNGTPFTFSVTAGALPTGVSLTSGGALTGTPTATGTFSFTIKVTDAYGCSATASFSIAVRPLAASDSYATLVNNTQAYVAGGLTAAPATPAAALTGSILANDLPAGGTTVSTGTFATTAGGSVTIASDGTFLYTPPLAFATSDSFNYTITSDSGATGTPTSANGTVTLALANRVWYIDPNAGINGNGRSNTPWNNTGSIGGTLAGDILFVYANGGVTTNTNAKITLLASQQLVGQGVNLIVNGFPLVAASSAPTLTASGNDVVAVNNGNTISGVRLANATNNLVSGTATNGLTITSSTLAPSGSANGISLVNATGSIVVQNATLSGSGSGNVVNAAGGSATWTFASSPVTQTAGRAVNVSGTSGNMTFDASSLVTVSAGTTDGAVTLTNDSGTIVFTGKLALTASGTARGLVVSNDGAVTVSDPNSTISTADSATLCGGGNCSAAVDASTTALLMTFKSVSVNGANGHVPVGLSFNGTTGSFSVNGDGTGHANGSGGSISGATAEAAYFVGASGTYAFKSMNTTLGASSLNGWLVDNNSGSASPTVNVTGCTFSGANSVTQNKALLQFEAGATSNVTANVQNSYFNNSRSYGLFAVAQGSSVLSVTLNQSGFGTNVNSGAPVNNPGTSITLPNASGAFAIVNSASAQVDYSVTNNTIWGTDALNGAIWAATISGGVNTGASHLNGSFTGNEIGKSGVASSGCANNCGGLGLLPGTAGTFDASVTNNSFRQINSTNVGFQNSVSGSTATAIGHINNNTFAEPDTTGGPILRAVLVSLGNSGGASVSGCLELNGNTVVGPGWFTGAWMRITNANNTVPLSLAGLTPASGATNAQVAAYVEGQNTFTGGSGTDVSVNVGTAGINGGSPCP